MLRTLKHAFQSPRLIGIKGSASGSVATVNIGDGDIAGSAAAGTGRFTATILDTFNRAPIVVGSPFANVGIEASCQIATDPTVSNIDFRTSAGGGAADGSLNALILGYDAQDADYIAFSPFSVKNAWRSARIELFKVISSVTPTLEIGGEKATVTRNGVGDYTITFKKPFANDNIVAVPTVIRATSAHHHIVTATATAVRVVVGAGGTASETAPFYLVVLGTDNPNPGYRGRSVTKVSDRLPRLVAGQIAYSGGVPSIVTGTGDFTVADTGTGNPTVTLTEPFAREPIVIASKDNSGNVTIGSAASISSIDLRAFVSGGGAAADPGDIHFMAFGFDDASEYAVL